MTKDDATDATEDTRLTTWGRTRGGTPALAIAVPVGLVLAAAFGGLSVLTEVAGPRPWLGALAFTVMLAAPSIALVLALVVDRSTMRGSVERPEESVEAGWYQKAASGALTDLVLVVAVGAVVTSLWRVDLAANLLLAAIIAVAMLAFATRYLLLRTGRLA